MPISTSSSHDVIRRAVVLVLSVAQVAAPPLLFPDGFRAASPAAGVVPSPTPLEPAGYAFVIWGLIFGGSLVYGVMQALPRIGGAPVHRAVGWRIATGFAASVAWLVCARFGPLWATVPLIFLMWGTLASALVTTAHLARDPAAMSPAPRPRKLAQVLLATLGLYAGWLSVAIVANTAEVLRAYGFGFPGAPIMVWSIAALLAAAAGVFVVLARSGYSLAYAAAVDWALIGIAVANVTRGLSTVVAALAVLLAVVVAVVALRRRRPSRLLRAT